ncbi:MAG: GxxExxY protein, partial [Candidatus Brennerbacteria bacterium]
RINADKRTIFELSVCFIITSMPGHLLYKDLSYQIRGACFEVYKKFGGDFKESVINKALVKEFTVRGIKVENQRRINLVYKGDKVGTYVPDVVVDDKIVLELKAKPFISEGDERQFWRYFKATDYKLGFLVNFGSRKLEIKRRVFDEARHPCLTGRQARSSA